MTSKSLLVVCLLPLGCLAVYSEMCVEVNTTFGQYMAAHGKAYAKESAEYVMRERLFNERVAEIHAHNTAGHSWRMGLNTFSDWTEAELQSLRGYKRRHLGAPTPSSVLQLGNAGDAEPSDKPKNQPSGSTESMDWSARLATSKDVMNQGPCGSCWAVAATAAVQLHAAKAYPKFNKILSPENINKCAPNPMMCGGEGGCQGSTPELAFKYLKSLGSSGGLYSMDTLPYTAATGMKIPADDCSTTGTIFQHFRANPRSLASKPSVSIADWVQVPTNNAPQVMDALVKEGPLAVAVVGAGIQGYRSGIISSCKSTVVDHAVVLMGFGKDPQSNMLYWNIRNSWGTSWGEKGFFRLKRNYANTASTIGTSALQGVAEEPCAWDNDPAKGVACKDDKGEYPKQTWVCGECGIISDVAYPKGVTVDSALLS